MQYFEPIEESVETEILKIYDKTKESIQDDIKAIQTWLSTQPHLPNTLTEKQIRSYIIICRGSVETTKNKIDMYYTMRTLFPDIFKDSHPFSDRILLARKYIYCLPMPKLSPDYSRIVLMKLKDADPTYLDPYAMCAHILNAVDVRLFEDLCHGHTIIYDLEHAKLVHAVKISPTLIKMFYTIGHTAFTTKVNAIHLINVPTFVDQTVFLVKTIINPNLASKIIVHKDLKSMLELVDVSYLPKDYGGKEKSLDELEALFYKKFEEYRDFFDRRVAETVKEELRPTKNIIVHKDLKSMLELVDVSYLPKDYGGKEKSLDELEALFYKKFEEYKEFFDRRVVETVKEELRPTKNVNDDILGYYGNFKKLDID